MTVAAPISPPPHPFAPRDVEGITLQNVSWDTYERLLDDLADQHVRMIYDEGTLTMMAPSARHDQNSRRLSRIIYAYTEIHRIPVSSFGSATWKRSDLLKGLEPDECFYIQSEPKIRGRVDLRLPDDPPPDLAIEVEMTSVADQKMQVYAALGVPEVWRTDGVAVRIAVLGREAYRETDQSRNLPGLGVSLLQRLLAMQRGLDETSWIGKVRDELTGARPSA